MNGKQSKFLRKKARQIVGKERTFLMIQVFKAIVKMSLCERIGVACRIILKRA